MRVCIVILFLVALPVAAMSQQSSGKPSDGKDCPLSRWSTTGAACSWAPYMSPAEEAKLRSPNQHSLTPAHQTLPTFRNLTPDGEWKEIPVLPASHIFKKFQTPLLEVPKITPSPGLSK